MCEKLLVEGLTTNPAMDMRPLMVIPILWDREMRVYKIPMHDVTKSEPGVYSIEPQETIDEWYKNGEALRLHKPIEMGVYDVLIQTYDKLVVLVKYGSWEETFSSFMAHEKKMAIEATLKCLSEGDKEKALRLMYYATRCE